MGDPGNGTLGDDHIVEADVVEDDVTIPLDGDVQHHAGIQLVVVICQAGKLIQLGALQLCHEAHGADIDAQHGDILPGGSFRHVQDGAVAAEADHHLGVLELPIQTGEAKIPRELEALVHLEGQAELRFDPDVPQHLHGCPDGLETLVPVGIRG